MVHGCARCACERGRIALGWTPIFYVTRIQWYDHLHAHFPNTRIHALSPHHLDVSSGSGEGASFTTTSMLLPSGSSHALYAGKCTRAL